MITKKSRQMILIISVLAVIAVIFIVLLMLYLKTDMFKSKKTLFLKYVESSMDNANSVIKSIKKEEYEKIKSENMYTSNTDINVKYTEGLGTSSENTDNEINKISVNIKGQSDKTNNYKYDEISVQKEDDTFNVEYIQNDNNYGIRFSDLFKQFIMTNDGDPKEIFEAIGYTDEQLSNIPENLEIENEINDIFEITKEETILKEKYIAILNENIESKNISKKSNQIVQINNKDIKTNAYIIKFTKEQFNDLIVKILEAMKDDEIILNKLDKIDTFINQCSFVAEVENKKDVKEEFVSEISKKIEKIQKTNIGNEETQIIVYENERNAVKVSIQYVDYTIDIDFILSGEEKYLQIKNDVSGNNVKLQNIILSSKDNGLNLSILNQTNDEKKEISLTQNLEMNESSIDDSVNIIYEDNENRVSADILKQINIVDEIKNKVDLKNDNSIIINDIQDENYLNALKTTVNENLKKEVDNKFDNKTREDIKKVLQIIGIVEEEYNIEIGEGTTEAERNRFNSQFEILQGEKITGDNITRIVNAITKNIVDLKVSSNTKLKVQIDKNNVNEELAKKLSEFMEKNNDKEYNISVEYDETTGFVNYINIDVVQENE